MSNNNNNNNIWNNKENSTLSLTNILLLLILIVNNRLLMKQWDKIGQVLDLLECVSSILLHLALLQTKAICCSNFKATIITKTITLVLVVFFMPILLIHSNTLSFPLHFQIQWDYKLLSTNSNIINTFNNKWNNNNKRIIAIHRLKDWLPKGIKVIAINFLELTLWLTKHIQINLIIIIVLVRTPR